MYEMIPSELMAYTGRVLAAGRPDLAANSDVTILDAERGRFVLKAGSTPERLQSLQAERQVLAALGEQVPAVPAPVASAGNLFLFTYLAGGDLVKTACSAAPTDRHRLMAGFAAALRTVHGWQPDLPGPAAWVLSRIESASEQPDIVFTHGDYCLPNALVTDGQVSGIIDWSTGGYSDRRVDLAAAVWSIRYNLQDETYVDTFLQAYGYRGQAGDLHLFEEIWQEA